MASNTPEGVLLLDRVQDSVWQMAASQLDALIETSLNLRPRTKALYRECVAEFVAFAGTDARGCTPAMVESWLYKMLEDRKPQTVNVYRKAIRYASKRYAKHELGSDFAAKVEKVKAPSAEKREPISYEEASDLLTTCDGEDLVNIRDRALIVLALRTGLRRGGIQALEMSGIRPPKITTLNKGGGSLTFEADTETFSALDTWLACLRRHGVTQGIVFLNVRKDKIHGRMSAFQIWKVFDRRAKQAGIRHVFPHLARHSTVTWLRAEGKSSAEVGKLTGQSERTVENIYTHTQTRGAVSAALPSLFKKRK